MKCCVTSVDRSVNLQSEKTNWMNIPGDIEMSKITVIRILREVYGSTLSFIMLTIHF